MNTSDIFMYDLTFIRGKRTKRNWALVFSRALRYILSNSFQSLHLLLAIIIDIHHKLYFLIALIIEYGFQHSLYCVQRLAIFTNHEWRIIFGFDTDGVHVIILNDFNRSME